VALRSRFSRARWVMMDQKHLWRSLRTARPAVRLGLAAFLAYSARTACFGRFGMGWIVMSLLIAAAAYGGTRHRFAARLVIGLFTLGIAGNLGFLTYQVYRYGTVLVCPSGSSRTSSASYSGSWVSCLQPDGTPLGPAIGTSYGGDGSVTDFYEEYRRRNGKLVGLRVGCGHPTTEPFEICFPEEHGQRCEPAGFQPPLPWKGCSNLSARVAEGFARKCRTLTAPSEVCY